MELWMKIVLGFLGLVQFWTMYLAVMNLKRNSEKLTAVTKVLGYPLLYIGLVLDVFFNWTIGTILYLEFPREGVFTSRLSRHYGCGGWREKISIWFCKNLLDPFDPSGRHCDPACKPTKK